MSPSYVFKGRTYTTVNGLSKAIFTDSGCDSHSMVVNRVITATIGRREAQRVVARYTVSAPVLGQPRWCADGVPVHARHRQILPMPAAEERFDEYAALRARSRAESAVWIDRWSRGDLK